MLHFQQNFVYYMMVEVIQPRYHQFEVAMRGVSSIDDVLRCHGDFQDTCLKECLISADEQLLKILTKLMTICLLFADHTERFARAYKVDEEQAAALLRSIQSRTVPMLKQALVAEHGFPAERLKGLLKPKLVELVHGYRLKAIKEEQASKRRQRGGQSSGGYKPGKGVKQKPGTDQKNENVYQSN